MTQVAQAVSDWQDNLAPAVRSDSAPDEITISVVIPSYNHAQYIPHAISSVDRQSHPFIQLVIVDDGSTDDSVAVIRQTLSTISITDVVFVCQDNQGAHAAINRGIELSRGAYIAILNSDDMYHPTRLSTMFEFLNVHRSDFAISTLAGWRDPEQTIDESGIYAGWMRDLIRYPAVSWSILQGNLAISTSNFFFRRELYDRVGGFRDFVMLHDWDFLLRVCTVTEPAIMPHELLYYRLHPENTFKTRFKKGLAYREYRSVLRSYLDQVRLGSVQNRTAPGYTVDERYLDLLSTPTVFSRIGWFHPDLETLSRTVELDFTDAHSTMTPPTELLELVGSLTPEHYHEVGTEFVQYFVELADLKPDAAVLDIGCGSGRIAISLTSYLGPEARYEGFDIVPAAIEWATENISSRFENFRFQVADIRNSFYNPDGPIRAQEYEFPYADESFDFVFLTSVFTHVLPAEFAQYTKEIGRVLKPGGVCLATFFLERAEAASDSAALHFTIAIEGCRTVREDYPELAVCYREDDVISTFESAGLTLRHDPILGSWSGVEDSLSFQDIVIVSKAANS